MESTLKRTWAEIDLDALIDPSARVDFHTGKVQR